MVYASRPVAGGANSSCSSYSYYYTYSYSYSPAHYQHRDDPLSYLPHPGGSSIGRSPGMKGAAIAVFAPSLQGRKDEVWLTDIGSGRRLYSLTRQSFFKKEYLIGDAKGPFARCFHKMKTMRKRKLRMFLSTGEWLFTIQGGCFDSKSYDNEVYVTNPLGLPVASLLFGVQPDATEEATLPLLKPDHAGNVGAAASAAATSFDDSADAGVNPSAAIGSETARNSSVSFLDPVTSNRGGRMVMVTILDPGVDVGLVAVFARYALTTM